MCQLDQAGFRWVNCATTIVLVKSGVGSREGENYFWLVLVDMMATPDHCRDVICRVSTQLPKTIITDKSTLRSLFAGW